MASSRTTCVPFHTLLIVVQAFFGGIQSTGPCFSHSKPPHQSRKIVTGFLEFASSNSSIQGSRAFQPWKGFSDLSRHILRKRSALRRWNYHNGKSCPSIYPLISKAMGYNFGWPYTQVNTHLCSSHSTRIASNRGCLCTTV